MNVRDFVDFTEQMSEKHKHIAFAKVGVEALMEAGEILDPADQHLKNLELDIKESLLLVAEHTEYLKQYKNILKEIDSLYESGLDLSGQDVVDLEAIREVVVKLIEKFEVSTRQLVTLYQEMQLYFRLAKENRKKQEAFIYISNVIDLKNKFDGKCVSLSVSVNSLDPLQAHNDIQKVRLQLEGQPASE